MSTAILAVLIVGTRVVLPHSELPNVCQTVSGTVLLEALGCLVGRLLLNLATDQSAVIVDCLYPMLSNYLLLWSSQSTIRSSPIISERHLNQRLAMYRKVT
jgi:hypothetical protein